MKPQYFLIGLALLTLFFLLELFSPFLKAMLVALLLTMATSSLYAFVYKKIKIASLTSLLFSFLIAVIFFVPLVYFIISIASFLSNIDKTLIIHLYETLKAFILNIPDKYLPVKHQLILLLGKVNISDLMQDLVSLGGYLGKNSANFVIDMMMILVFYFFINFYLEQISNFVKDILPIKAKDGEKLFKESSNVMSLVLYSILATAIFEGILFGILMNFFSNDALLLGILYGFASLVPVIGGMIMWAPIAGLQLYHGNTSSAIVIVAYSIIVISIIADTFIKPMIIKYINTKIIKAPTQLNELLIFFSIIAGLSTFGFWGMIIGPSLVTFFISILELLKKYGHKS